MHAENSYWAVTAPYPEPHTADLPDRVDCVVVGGGYSGLSAATHLAKKKASVAVLERERIGWGASSRNGGMVLPGLKVELEALARQLGLEAARRMYEMSVEAVELVRDLTLAEKIDCELQSTGELYAAWKPAHFKAMCARLPALEKRFGRTYHVIPPEELASELGTTRYHGALVDENAMGLHPRKYVLGLAQSAMRAGATLHEGMGVTRIERTASGFTVITPRGVIRSKHVIIATNGYTGGITPWHQRRIVPVGSYIIATEPLDQALADRLIPKRRMVFDSKNMLYYFRILPDNRMLFGGRASFVPTSEEKTGAILRRGMVELFPDLREVPVAYSWGGTLGFAMDLMPHAGIRDGMHYSLGYAGHGVALATYMGKRLAESITEGKEIPFSNTPFWPIPFYWGWPWFLPFAGMYYEFMDMVS
jgi:glycine/D-amino acid oxidase-like deaminating enzyme